jgi:eukaryotic-like serine/threonine-protein kinase
MGKTPKGLSPDSVNRERISRLFEECCDYPPEQWDNLLERMTGTDENVRVEVKKLLSNKKRAEVFFESLGNRIDAELSPHRHHIYKPGQRIQAFKLRELISRGGMAVVFLAEKTGEAASETGKQLAAIKIMSCHAGNPWKFFRKEQSILYSISHPGIARLYDYGITREGMPYIIMEYIKGVAIDRFCDLHNPEFSDRLGLILQICDAVGYLHRKMIIHQDIKPSNLLADKSGKVKVIDLGVATVLHDAGNRSRERGFSGTLDYAPPERIKGEALSYASDIYQIGMVMHKLVAGALPPAVFDPAAFQECSPGVENLPRQVRTEMARIFSRSLSPDPAGRYQGAENLKEDIRKILVSIASPA